MGVISSRNVDVSPQNLLCQHGRGRWAVFGDFLDRLRGWSRAGGLERDVRLKMKGSTDRARETSKVDTFPPLAPADTVPAASTCSKERHAQVLLRARSKLSEKLRLWLQPPVACVPYRRAGRWLAGGSGPPPLLILKETASAGGPPSLSQVLIQEHAVGNTSPDCRRRSRRAFLSQMQ